MMLPQNTTTKSKKHFIVIKSSIPLKDARSCVNRLGGDLGTQELKKRMDVSLEVRERHSNGEPKAMGGRVRDQTPMDRYFQRRQLDKENDRNYMLFQAGERLLSDFYYAGLTSRTCSSYEPRIKSRFNFMEHRQDRLKSYKNAMKEVPETLRAVLVHVCCLQGAAHEWSLRNGHVAESGIVVLRLALTELALHYGMIKKDVDICPPHKVAIRIV